MINKSKGDLAYNILDLDSSLNDEVLILLTKFMASQKSGIFQMDKNNIDVLRKKLIKLIIN